MISLSQFRANIFQHFKLMRDAGATFKVYHRRKVYNISVTPATEEETEHLRQIKPYNLGNNIDKADVTMQNCRLCGDVLVNGICMNRSCENAKVAQ